MSAYAVAASFLESVDLQDSQQYGRQKTQIKHHLLEEQQLERSYAGP